ncbi:unnamed protein product [Rotaria sp. Silwood2]|nr:unnamed protein product [Rotaria sp. Silwood2]
MLDDTGAVHIPLEPAHGTTLLIDEPPPAYENPKIDFSSGWKDRVFAILFYIHVIGVIIVGLVLGLPALIASIKENSWNQLKANLSNQIKANSSNQVTEKSFDINVKIFLFALGTAAGLGILVSFLTFFLLQQCAGRIIKASFIITVVIEVLLIVALAFVFWPLCFIPGMFLFFTLIYISCIRKRIPFAEAHLGAGCAVLRSHPSLLLIAFIMLIVELLWFVLWFLMVLGIQRASNNTILIFNTNTTTNVNNGTKFNMINTKSTPIYTVPPMTTRMQKFTDTARYSMDKNSKSINSTKKRINDEIQWFNATDDSTSSKQGQSHRIVSYIILFLVLLSWYWGATTFGNITNFVTACAVGHWWFTGEGSRQYTIGASVRRAFTTNFGTICLGSLLEAIIKALRSCVGKDRRKNIIATIADCILQLLEKLIGYLNEWAFIYSALTGQTFVQAGRSFIELFKKRGWTAIINDVLVGTTMMIVNIAIGLTSSIAGGLLIYFFMSDSPEKIITIIIASIISFIISVLMSAVMASILSSCVRTIFVCFALNPAALGATHPDHLQALTNAWNKFYPQEFATSGYAQHLPKPTMSKDL